MPRVSANPEDSVTAPQLVTPEGMATVQRLLARLAVRALQARRPGQGSQGTGVPNR
jgi:hypothetical protein